VSVFLFLQINLCVTPIKGYKKFVTTKEILVIHYLSVSVVHFHTALQISSAYYTG